VSAEFDLITEAMAAQCHDGFDDTAQLVEPAQHMIFEGWAYTICL